MAASVKTVVIGGAGFIGRSLVDVLTRAGREVIIIDTHTPPPHPKVQFIQGDYSDRTVLEALKDADEVVLLAYSSVPKTSFEDPLADITDNLPKTLEFFNAAIKYPLKKIVVISSGGTVYGPAQRLPIDEDHPTNPVSPYGITKLAVEKYALMYHHLYQLPVVIVRPANAYGPGQRPFAGQGFIATAIAKLLEGQPITLFGERGGIRDYIFVDDIAEGIFAALKKGKIGQVYNLGTGVGTDNRAILKALDPFLASDKIKLNLDIRPERKFDVRANVLDSTKLTTGTNWKANTPLKVGLTKTWQWFATHYQPMTTKKPTVTVLMPVYNAGVYLKAAIQSILDQTFTDFELLIINDASTDQSEEVIRSFDDPRIKLVVNPKNLNLIGTLNKGLKLASGEFIARMDQDDISLPTRLEEQVEFLRSSPETVLVGTEATVINPEGEPIGYDWAFLDDQTIRRALMTTNAFVHGSVMFRKSAATKLGGYSKDAYLAEDYDLWIRLAGVGQVANLPKPLYRWRANPTGMSLSNAKKQRLAAEKLAKTAWKKFNKTLGRPIKSRVIRSINVEDAPKRQHKLAELEIQLARGYFYRRERSKAIGHVLAALRKDAQFWQFYPYLLMTFLPEKWFFNLESAALDRMRTKRGY